MMWMRVGPVVELVIVILFLGVLNMQRSVE